MGASPSASQLSIYDQKRVKERKHCTNLPICQLNNAENVEILRAQQAACN